MVNLNRRILETVYACLKKERTFNDKQAFESIEIDSFVRDVIASLFAQKLAMCSKE